LRFKKLELLGFKSFAEHTELVFEPGITAIVGPNGCGKSNIADSIKWVLGEQSARELRGGRMEDLIFNGSDRRDPIHFAEVSLTLDNTDQQLPIDYSEVTISRRLFRSGESEYLLNKTPVRLKDITQLLMGTGVGTSAYSLFEQGRIEQIIGARPEDRRLVFEEAAGITKYKAQKREALRKLDQTEENLARVTDVIAEVKRQIQSMERQVRRARAYQEQFEELKLMEVRAARGEIQRLNGQWQDKETSFGALRSKIADLERQSQEQEGRLAQAREAVSQANHAFTQAREALLRATHQQETAQSSLQMNRERIVEAGSRDQTIHQELASAQTHLEELQAQQAELAAAAAQAADERRTKEEKVAQCEVELTTCAQEIEQAQAAVRQAQEKLMEATGAQTQVKNTLSRIYQERSRLEARVSRLQMEEGKVTVEQDEARSKVEELEEALNQARQNLAALEEERRRLRDALTATEARFTQTRTEAYSLEQEATRLTSQHEILKGLLESHEGYSSGVKTLLSALDEGRLEREGICGVLAELIQVNSGDMAAMDAALGPWAEAVVVKTTDAAERCRRFLETCQAGRVLFLIQDRIPAEMTAHPPACTSIPGAQALSERIGITPHLDDLLKLILADTWLVPDRGSAMSILEHWADGRQPQGGLTPCGSRMVTPAGELFTVATALLGCAPNEEGMIIGRMSRLKSLEVASAHAEKQLEEARIRLAAIEAERDRDAQNVTRLETNLNEQHKSVERVQATHASAAAVLKKLDEEKELLKIEKVEAEAELQEAQGRVAEQEGVLAQETQTLESIETDLQENRQRIAHTTERREGISVALAETKTQLASFDEVISHRSASLKVMEQSIQTAQSTIAARRQELEQLQLRRQECETAVVRLEGELQALGDTRIQVQGEVDQTEGRRAETVSQTEAQERQFLNLNRTLEQSQSQLHAQEMERAQLTFKQQQITSRLQQVYQMNLEEQGAESPASEEEMPALRGKIDELSQKLQRMGPVNLASIDEERELQNRHEYLSSQQADLVKAKDDLHAAITRINRTTRTMFRETFVAIQKEFQVCFKQLFGGGEARLMLMDEEDVLESGIEIIARPPGKQLQTISLLSGGEKALTTIALLFAIFRVKPSPFCLLDEIDAPLDESNVGRFAASLREFLKESQFIIITHNKKTISMADIMYGVTMEERGVSKLVSVKLNGNGNGNGKVTVTRKPKARS